VEALICDALVFVHKGSAFAFAVGPDVGVVQQQQQ